MVFFINLACLLRYAMAFSCSLLRCFMLGGVFFMFSYFVYQGGLICSFAVFIFLYIPIFRHHALLREVLEGIGRSDTGLVMFGSR